jgi:hypothetical protein
VAPLVLYAARVSAPQSELIEPPSTESATAPSGAPSGAGPGLLASSGLAVSGPAAPGILPVEGLRVVVLLLAVGYFVESILAVALRGLATERILAWIERIGVFCTCSAFVAAAVYAAVFAYRALDITALSALHRTLYVAAVALSGFTVAASPFIKVTPIVQLPIACVLSLAAVLAAAASIKSPATRAAGRAALFSVLIFVSHLTAWLLVALASVQQFGLADSRMRLCGAAAVLLQSCLVLGLLLWLVTATGKSGRILGYVVALTTLFFVMLAVRGPARNAVVMALHQALAAFAVPAAPASFAVLGQFVGLLGLLLGIAIAVHPRQLPESAAALALVAIARGHWDQPALAMGLLAGLGALISAGTSRDRMWHYLLRQKEPDAPGQDARGLPKNTRQANSTDS